MFGVVSTNLNCACPCTTRKNVSCNMLGKIEGAGKEISMSRIQGGPKTRKQHPLPLPSFPTHRLHRVQPMCYCGCSLQTSYTGNITTKDKYIKQLTCLFPGIYSRQLLFFPSFNHNLDIQWPLVHVEIHFIALFGEIPKHLAHCYYNAGQGRHRTMLATEL